MQIVGIPLQSHQEATVWHVSCPVNHKKEDGLDIQSTAKNARHLKKKFFTLKFDHQLIELTRLLFHNYMNMIQQSFVINDWEKQTGFNGFNVKWTTSTGTTIYTHSEGKVMQQNDYKAQWKITWYNIDETFNITATVQNEKHTCKIPSQISSIPCLHFWMCVI